MRYEHPKKVDQSECGLRLAVVAMEGSWRLFIGAEPLGRFADHADALECALQIAREALRDGASVEVLDQTAFGEVTRVADDRVH
jgi:hypothetical protein